MNLQLAQLFCPVLALTATLGQSYSEESLSSPRVVKPLAAGTVSELARLRAQATLAEHSAYDWRVTAIQMAIANGSYATARAFVSPSILADVAKSGNITLHGSPAALNRSSAAGWEAGYYGAMLGRGDYSIDPKQGALGGLHCSSTGNSFFTTSGGGSDFAGNLQLWRGFGGLIATIPHVASARFTSEGDKLLCVDSHDNALAIRSADTGKQLKSIRLGEDELIAGACDKGCLLRSRMATAYQWVDFATGKVTRCPLYHDPLAVAPDGRYYVDQAGRKQLLIESTTGTPITELKPPASDAGGYLPLGMAEAVFSADSRTVAVEQSDRHTILVWPTANGQAPLKVDHNLQIHFFNLSADGKYLLALTEDRALTVTDILQSVQIAKIYPGDLSFNRYGGLESPSEISIAKDGKRLMAIDSEGVAEVWKLPVAPNRAHAPIKNPGYAEPQSVVDPTRLTAADNRLTEHDGTTTSAAFSPYGYSIITASLDGSIRFWDLHAVSPMAELRGHAYPVVQASFSPSGNLVCTASDDGTAQMWDTDTGKMLVVFRGHKYQVTTTAFSHKGWLVCTASLDGTARVWSTNNGSSVETLIGHKYGINSVEFSPDDTHILTASKDGTAAIWNEITKKRELELKGHKYAVNMATYSPNGKLVLTASLDGTAAIWDSATGKRLRVLAGHNFGVTFAKFSANGKRIMTASEDGTARIWETTTGKCVLTLKHGPAVSCAAISPAGWQAVTASADGAITVWNLETGAKFLSLQGHSGAVTSATFSPDGKRILTSSEDCTARVWDSLTGRTMAVLGGHAYGLTSAAFSSDGGKIVTTSKDCSARIWYSYARLVE